MWFVSDGHRDRVDFFWRACRGIGESDGYGKYSLRSGESPLAALKHEKSREDRLRRQVRSFSRWDYAETLRATPLEIRLLQDGIPQVHPRQTAMLRTLRINPRSF